MTPESEHQVEIGPWHYDPRDLDHPEGQMPYAVGVHNEHPGIQTRIEYDQALNPRSVSLTAIENGPNVTARLIRKYPIGSVDAAARAHMATWWREYDRGRPEAARTASPIPRDALSDIDIRRPGRRGRPDIEYARLASDYVNWLDKPNAGPVEEFAKTKFLSVSQLRNLLYEHGITAAY